MRKIQTRNRIQLGAYKCMDVWSEPIWVDDRTTTQGDMTQFYRRGYTLFALARNEYRYIN